MNHGSQPKSRLTAVTFAGELPCPDRAGSIVNITSQWQDPQILISCYKRTLQKKVACWNPLCPNVVLIYIHPFRGYRWKTGPHEAETDKMRIIQYLSCHSHLTSSQSRTRANTATAVKRVKGSYWDSPFTGTPEDTGTGPISQTQHPPKPGCIPLVVNMH